MAVVVPEIPVISGLHSKFDSHNQHHTGDDRKNSYEACVAGFGKKVELDMNHTGPAT